ncbi:replicative DNA helicase [Ruminococcus sp.]|uniref:replicative DNA helicase n=1 Tax=Ruminococcus sp. TaxID=41978 RepID=UPI0026064AB6|nr:replicative DNA helicase [Ruminococcus sp.]MDD6989312.1 replicative DNA helicase [Ruminococcus sp.]MDY6202166.1 replicative DNA helicase [Ruminococcus sp.]
MADSLFSGSYDSLNMPYSPEAEQAVLGAIILDSTVFDKVVDYIKSPDYFYVALHKIIFMQMQEMINFGAAIDFVTLLEKLKQNKAFDEATGKTYLYDLVNNCPSISNAEAYAKVIADKYNIRRLITASREIIDDASAGDEEPSVLIDSAEQKIFDIRKGNEKSGLERINSVILQTFDRLDALNSETDDSMKPISTGIGDLDRVITGLNRSDLILLAARPGMGKTSFALNIARNAACQSKKTVAFFSLEMSKEQLASRLLSTEALISGTKLRTGKLSEEEWSRLIPASDVLSKAELYLDDTPGITITEMKSRLRRLRNLDLVVIDYLQLMGSGRRIDNRVQEISEITRNLKILAKEMNVPVITLSQLSRASEQRTDHRPQLSDLRDSGSIEQDADIVLFLYREGYYSEKNAEQAAPTADMNSGECIVAKNRHGEAKSVKLHWQGEFMRFTGTEARDE